VAGAPCGPINDLGEAFDLAERLGLAPVVQLDDPRRDAPAGQVADPLRLSATPAAYRLAPPRRG
jgi:crotonobetainyl-CoA:carnitine CoA-transferase CaiB-like acyl-CoA transferase